MLVAPATRPLMENDMTPAPAKTIARPIADAVGITGSLLCALHCLIVPLSLVFGPIQSLAIVDDELFHRALLLSLIHI